MFAVASQIVICLLLAAIIGMVIGYFLGRISCMNDEKESYTIEKSDKSGCEESSSTNETILSPEDSLDDDPGEDSEEVSNMVSPAFLGEARASGKDNLTRIKGIGSKIEEKLNNLGVIHFDQVASWNEGEIAWVDDHLAFRGRIKREKWVDQAKVLAEGGETDFSKRVDAGEVASSKKL